MPPSARRIGPGSPPVATRIALPDRVASRPEHCDLVKGDDKPRQKRRAEYGRPGRSRAVRPAGRAAGNGWGEAGQLWAATLLSGACLVNVAKSRLRFARPGTSEP